jgi:hypothetical protein
MTLGEAWIILGKNPQKLAEDLEQYPRLKDKVIAVEAAYVEAQKLSKKLMAKNHPDVNHDPDAADKFRQIQQALEVIRVGTEEFKTHVDGLVSKKKDVVVVVG